MTNHGRRTFLKASIAAATLGRTLSGAQTAATSLRLGGPVFTRTDDPDALAQAHRQLGYRAAYCPDIPLKDEARIRAVSQAFQKHDVVIAEVGKWVNLMDPDAGKRRRNVQTVTEGLALAEAAGALCCVDITGSLNPTRWDGPHPDNISDAFFDQAVRNARGIIDAVKPKRARFCYEMMPWAIPDSPDSALKLVKAVDRDAFAVHMDPCNLINSPVRFYRSVELLNECFDKLGRWIVSCHAKDLAWGPGGQVYFREVCPGTGSLDYRTYLGRLVRMPRPAPLMLEHLSGAQEYDKARAYVQEVARANSIGL